MRAASSTKADDIDLFVLLGALRRSLPKLVLFSALVGGSTFGVLSIMAPRYSAETQLSVVARSTNMFPDAKREGSQGDSVAPRVDKEAINTHVRALSSAELIFAVSEQLRLKERPEFNSAVGPLDMFGQILQMAGLGGPKPGQSERDRVLEVVYRQLEVSAAKESRFINLRFSSADPQLAADFTNRLAETYRLTLIAQPVQETENVVAALEPKVEQLRRELIDAEAAVERYRAANDLSVGGAQRTPVNDQRMASLNDELTKAEGARAETDARWRTARELLQTDAADALPDVQKSPLIQGLISQRVRLERQVAEAQASLLPAHPRMQQLNADLAGLKRQIKAEVLKLMQGFEKEAKAATFRVETIARQIAELKTKVGNTSGSEAQLKALDSAARSKRAELEGLQKQLEINRTLRATRAVPIEAQIISQAQATSVPIWPKKGPWSALAGLAALILGAVTVVTSAIVSGPSPASGGNGRVSKATRVQTRTAAEAIEPSFAAPAAPITAQAVAAPASAAKTTGPTAADIAEHLLLRGAGQTGLRTLTAAATRAIDPSQSAVAMAKAIGSAGKQVVLVDWTLSGPSVSETLGVASSPGMTEVLSGAAAFDDVITELPGSTVHFVPCGAAPATKELALDGDRLNMVLDSLDDVYDQIIVVSSFDGARDLFQAIQGRFDVGIMIDDTASEPPAAGQPQSFLGYDVGDLEVYHLQRTAGAPTVSAKRMNVARVGAPRDARA
jgi:uncharacterized protein involved in exopolysaccharide biosynthesis